MVKLEKALLGRNGLIGRHFIGGTDVDRQRMVWFRSQFNLWAIRERERLAQVLQHPPYDVIDHDAGFAVMKAGRIAGTDDIIEPALSFIDSIDPTAKAQGMLKKPQLFTKLLDTDGLTLDSPYLRFVLQPNILRSVSAYLGVVPILKDIDIWYSTHPGTEELANSQLYHCDWESVTQLKVFVHATDVTPDSGPLTVMGAKTSQHVRERLGYTYLNNGKDDTYGRITDEMIQDLIGDQDQHTLTGEAGTVAFVDTGRCLHYGSRMRAESPPRTLVYYQFLPPTAFTQPLDYRKRAPFRHLAHPGLSRLQRLVLGAEL